MPKTQKLQPFNVFPEHSKKPTINLAVIIRNSCSKPKKKKKKKEEETN